MRLHYNIRQYPQSSGFTSDHRFQAFPKYEALPREDVDTLPVGWFANGSSIMFLGDSTMRQIYHGFLVRLGVVSLEGDKEFRELVRNKCASWDASPWLRRFHYVSSIRDAAECCKNELVCSDTYTSTGMGSNLTVTYSWGHMIYDSMIRATLNNWKHPDMCQGDFALSSNNCPPDYLIFSLGVHDCYHYPFGVPAHIQNLQDMALHLASFRNKTRVKPIWVDITPSFENRRNAPASTMVCITMLNQEINRLSKLYQIPLFSRYALYTQRSVPNLVPHLHHSFNYMYEMVCKMLGFIFACNIELV